MDYPRQLNLDIDTQVRLKQYIDDELQKHAAENSKFRRDLIDMQHSYWAEPSDEEVTFPFKGASNLVIPLNAIAVEAVHARNMQTIFGLEDQLVSAKAISSEWADAQRPVEIFLNHELKNQIKIRTPLNDAILEIEKFGTGVAKTGYIKKVKRGVKIVNGVEKTFDVTIRSGACVDAVPLSRFIMPFSAQDPQDAPWCGEEHSDSPYEIQQKEYSGLFKDGTYDKLKDWVSTIGRFSDNEFENSQARLEEREPAWPSYIHWVELYLSWNVDQDESNRTKEIEVYYHPDSGTFLSVRYNIYEDFRRPYRKGVYFPIEHRWMGLGICKMNTSFQEEVTTIHRLQLDNATLANTPMFKLNKQSGYGPNEPIFPGKIWFLDDLDYLDQFKMGEVYPSAYNTENTTLNFSQQRLGINELTMGQPATGTPGTASDTLARVQEGSRKFGFFFDNIRDFSKELITDLACCIQQFGPSDIRYFDTADNGTRVEEFFKMPASMIRGGLLLDLNAAGQLDNKFADRQNYTQLAPMVEQYYQGMLQLAAQTQNPQLLNEVLKSGLLGATEIMKQILGTFDITNLSRILPNEQLLNAVGTQGATQSPGVGGIQGVNQTPQPTAPIGSQPTS